MKFVKFGDIIQFVIAFAAVVAGSYECFANDLRIGLIMVLVGSIAVDTIILKAYWNLWYEKNYED